MAVEPEADNEPPPILEVEGQRYVFCGFSEDMPRYRHKADTASG